MPRNVRDSVVVITGASSGIGRAAARAFAQRGAAVVVAARRAELLNEVVQECERAGGQAFAVPTDMSDEQAVQELARRAAEHFGRIDTWINNHGVTSFGYFDETPIDAFRRVIEVDFFGTVYGSRAALHIFQEQGSGVLINMGSMVSLLSEPFVSSYVSAKHAVRGLSMSLRQELMLKGQKNIHVCTVLPATIDTPFFQHAANFLGRAAKAMPPVYSAERVAETYVSLARRPRREVFVGNVARQMWLQFLTAPGLTERQIAVMMDRLHVYQDKHTPPTSGNLFAPMAEGAGASGGWGGRTGEQRRRLATAGVAAIVPAVMTWRWYQRRQAAPRTVWGRVAARFAR
ncbi:MAG: short-chain dehydrogenase [Chloroflexi bacterium]|nr:MAG: short-chain dehydrogenase [Chloroflexota bacterium]